MSQSGTIELLKSMGWSDELVEAYERVSEELARIANIPEFPAGITFDFSPSSQNDLDLSSTAPGGSNRLAITV